MRIFLLLSVELILSDLSSMSSWTHVKWSFLLMIFENVSVSEYLIPACINEMINHLVRNMINWLRTLNCLSDSAYLLLYLFKLVSVSSGLLEPSSLVISTHQKVLNSFIRDIRVLFVLTKLAFWILTGVHYFLWNLYLRTSSTFVSNLSIWHS